MRCLRCQTKLRVPNPKGKPKASRSRPKSSPKRGSAAASNTRNRKGSIASDTRRKAQAAIREILEEYEYAIEADERGFLIDVRGVTFGLARTLVEEVLEEAPGVRDVRLAGGLGACRLTVVLRGASFNPEDSFADEYEETEIYHRKSLPNQKTIDLDAIVNSAATNSIVRDPVKKLLDGKANAEMPMESNIGLVPDGSTRGSSGFETIDDYVVKGQACLDAGEVEKAVKILEKAVRIDKDHEDAVYLLATAYASIGEYDRARRAFRHFVKMCPNDPDGYVMHAAASVACDRLEDARAALVKAIRLDPNHPKAYRYAARLYDRLGDPVKAQQFRQRYNNRRGA
ncbi:MAG: tetratricopeptide repeat protein [Planctomycetota bacterium]|nr:tetratricopeptide repeat protein [Planctomycetota bacterium]